MNYLNGKTVYLCGAISYLQDSGVTWRQHITPRLQKLGINVIDPCSKTVTEANEVGKDKERFRELIKEEKWEELKKEFWPVVRYDLRSVDKSDFLILNYDAHSPTVGTWHEVVMASHIQKKPVLVKYDRSQLKDFNPWVVVLIKTGHLFPDWDSLFSHLDNVNIKNFNTSYWTL